MQDKTISLLAGEFVLQQPPRVFILLLAMQKIQCYARLSPGEVAGLGIVERRDNDFIIKDVFILRQRVSSANAEIDPDALNKYVAACEDSSALKFQWHSHGRITAFFSEEDKNTIEGYFNDFMISLVVNKQGEYQCRLDLFKPFRACFDAPLMVVAPADEAMLEFCRNEITKKVKDGLFGTAKRTIGFRGRRLREWNQKTSPLALPFEDLVGEALE